MLKLVQPIQYEVISETSLFQNLNDYLSLNIFPILNHSFPGQIWVDNIDNPEAGYIYDLRKAHFLIGKTSENREIISEFVKSHVYPIIRQSKYGSNFIYRTNWEIVNELEKFDFLKQSFVIQRDLYEFNNSKPPNLNSLLSNLPKEFKLVEVTKDILNLDLKNISGLQAELKYMWDNTDNFFTSGLGICAISDNSLAGWCLGEYFSNGSKNSYTNFFGIGIETYPEFQKKGIATAMAYSLVKKGLEKGYTIYWDCAKDNKASIRTALKVGFELLDEYEILYVPPF